VSRTRAIIASAVDHEADGESPVVVGGEEPCRVVARQRHGHQRRRGRQDVDRIVPRIGHQGGTAQAAADAELQRRHHAAHGDRHHEHGERQRGRRRVVLADVLQRGPADADAAERERQTDHEGGQRLEAAVAVWMVVVGGLGCGQHPEEHHRRGEDVARELDAGGDHRRGSGDDAGHQVHRREPGAGSDAGERHASATREIEGRRGRHETTVAQRAAKGQPRRGVGR
jgi:hypothetical protein